MFWGCIVGLLVFIFVVGFFGEMWFVWKVFMLYEEFGVESFIVFRFWIELFLEVVFVFCLFEFVLWIEVISVVRKLREEIFCFWEVEVIGESVVFLIIVDVGFVEVCFFLDKEFVCDCFLKLWDLDI